MQFSIREIAGIRASFERIAADADQAGELFYRRLFEIAPHLRPMFGEDIAQQGRKLINTLGVAVSMIENWESLAQALEDLAQRHVAYGVLPDHYPVVGKALVYMIREMSRSRPGGDIEAAWMKAYVAISDHMITSTKDSAATVGATV